MTREQVALLQEELTGLQLSAGHLSYSIERCRNLIGQEEMSSEQLERFESLTSRFARLADLLIQRIFRLIDEIELTGGGTILDRIYRAEKRGWANAAEMIKIRELRNLIAHEYANEKMPEMYAAVVTTIGSRPQGHSHNPTVSSMTTEIALRVQKPQQVVQLYDKSHQRLL